MVRRNNQTNRLILWIVIALDFVLLNAVILVFSINYGMTSWDWSQPRMFYIICNAALLASEWKFHSTIHQRLVSAADVLRRIFLLTMVQALIAYMVMRHVLYWMAVGWNVLYISVLYFVLLLLARLLERLIIKRLRQTGRNTRTVTLVGADEELWKVYEQMMGDPTTGYRVQGIYNDNENENNSNNRIKWLGTIEKLLESGGQDIMPLGDEMYVCLSRRRGEAIRALSQLCDRQMTKFYYIPVSVESIGLNLKREYINDIEVYTTHESPLENPLNKAAKRAFDIVVSTVALALTGVLFPFIYIVIKRQSPGPVFFRQLRTGMDGKNFLCYKFRSMHVNADSDTVQASKDDPRKFPFGNFMRKTNIDELPQFWNVLKGDMSVVGPRPHMLAHTDIYSRQIGEYMVRHFVKPGITGWAQVTGFRGETKELYQMEERVRRDIWYMENWTVWLDMRIVWMTVKSFFKHDENAY